MISSVDLLIFLGIQFLLYFCIFKSGWFVKLDSRVRRQFPIIWLYHLFFSVFYTFYIQQEGGDALRYWTVEADLSQYAKSWMGHFGFNTFFIQWLNYIPGKVLQLSFFVGNQIYGAVSLLGILLGMTLTSSYFPSKKNKLFLSYLPFLVWWFPGLHFWTAGVGKESLLLTALLGFWYATHFSDKQGIKAVFFWFFIVMVRPFIGLLFLIPLLKDIIKRLAWDKVLHWVLFLGLAAVSVFALVYVVRYSHILDYSFSDLLLLSQKQLEFLESYHAQTAIPMLEYPWWKKMLTVFFRPFLWESRNGYSVVFALENSVFLILILLIPFAVWKRKARMNAEIIGVFLLIMGVFFIYSMTLNNFGLIYRMKSVWLPFLYISLLWLIWPFIAKSTT